MRRIELFTIRVSAVERQMIARLADHLQRSQSDAVRLVIRHAAGQRGLLPIAPPRASNGLDISDQHTVTEGSQQELEETDGDE